MDPRIGACLRAAPPFTPSCVISRLCRVRDGPARAGDGRRADDVILLREQRVTACCAPVCPLGDPFSPGGLTLAAQTSEARGLADDERARVAADVDIEMVRVQVLYFARAREATGGMTEESFEVGGAAADTDALRAALVEKHPSLQSVLESCVLAVNQEYATGNTALSEGCEVAVIPPISGG